jgi:hypothetical protein
MLYQVSTQQLMTSLAISGIILAWGKRVKIPFHIPLAVLALTLPLTNASAISISLAPGSSARSSLFLPGAAPLVSEASFQSDGLSSFSATTSVSSGLSAANATWHILNSQSRAVFTGGNTLSAAGAFASVAIAGNFKFTLFEPVSYSITGFFFASLAPEAHAIMDAALFKGFPGPQRIPFEDVLYDDFTLVGFNPSPSLPLLIELDETFTEPFAHGSKTGILAPGNYTFHFDDSLGNSTDFGTSQGFGAFSLTLTSVPVPDAGSTMALIGMALCALGGISRRFKALNLNKSEV